MAKICDICLLVFLCLLAADIFSPVTACIRCSGIQIVPNFYKITLEFNNSRDIIRILYPSIRLHSQLRINSVAF